MKAEKSLERPHVQVLLERAEMWQALLDSGELKTRVEIAKRFGVAAGRVSNIMNLLKLAPEIQQTIRELPVGTPRRVMSEHGLRELARLPMGEQLQNWGTKRPGMPLGKSNTIYAFSPNFGVASKSDAPADPIRLVV